MTLQEKISLQKENSSKALAFKEGCFYKVFNEGVWLLRNKDFKVQQIGKGTLKSLFIGFPSSVLQTMYEDFPIKDNSSITEIDTGEPFEDFAYTHWQTEQMSLIGNKEVSSNKAIRDNAHQLINEIKEFPLASKTPNEVFIWIAQLQYRIQLTINN
jgi:hypothetical protein